MSFRNLSQFFLDISALISVREYQTGIFGIQRKRTSVQLSVISKLPRWNLAHCGNDQHCEFLDALARNLRCQNSDLYSACEWLPRLVQNIPIVRWMKNTLTVRSSLAHDFDFLDATRWMWSRYRWRWWFDHSDGPPYTLSLGKHFRHPVDTGGDGGSTIVMVPRIL